MAHFPTEFKARSHALPPIVTLVKVQASPLLENIAHKRRSISDLGGSYTEGAVCQEGERFVDPGIPDKISEGLHRSDEESLSPCGRTLQGFYFSKIHQKRRLL
jgi:hypothetical protein